LTGGWRGGKWPIQKAGINIRRKTWGIYDVRTANLNIVRKCKSDNQGESVLSGNLLVVGPIRGKGIQGGGTWTTARGLETALGPIDKARSQEEAMGARVFNVNGVEERVQKTPDLTLQEGGRCIVPYKKRVLEEKDICKKKAAGNPRRRSGCQSRP